MSPVLSPQAQPSPAPSGARLLATDGRALPLEGTSIRAEARGGIARVVLEQRFRNVHAEPLIVSYLVPLPADGAVSGFEFRVGDRRVVGEIDRREAARERFERAVTEGRTAAILEQDRASQFTQEIGNIPGGALVTARITIDQRLSWRDEGGWEWRFPTVVAPSYPGAPGRVPDAERVTVDVTTDPVAARAELSLIVGDSILEGRAPESPSHPIDVTLDGGMARVRFSASDAHGRELSATTGSRDAGEPTRGVRLDRDVVVRWAAARGEVGATLATAGATRDGENGDAHGLLTIVPPVSEFPISAFPRDLIVLIDSSGSMDGEPFEHARTVAAAAVRSLDPTDRLEMIAFGMEPVRWRKKPAAADAKAISDAVAWLRSLRPQGGTEMRAAIEAAFANPRPDSQRQVVLITDGLVGFEREIVAAVLRDLPPNSRLHVVGVGSAPNRSLTACAARAGRGVEVLVGLGEDAAAAGRRLVARTRAPLLTEVVVEGSAIATHAPGWIPDLFGAAPLLVPLRLRSGGGTIRVRALTPRGPWETEMTVAPVEPGSGTAALGALYAREAVEDLETIGASGMGRAVDLGIERLGLAYGIATRLTSWVAVSEEPSVDPGQPFRRERMPHAVPHGMSVEGLGLRAGTMSLAVHPVRSFSGLIEPYLGAMAGESAPDFPMFHQVSSGRPDKGKPMSRTPELPGPLPPEHEYLAGRVSRRGSLLDIEAEVLRNVHWHPGLAVMQLLDGTLAWAHIVPVFPSTDPGFIPPGQSIRFVLRDVPKEFDGRIELIVIGIRGEDVPLVIRIEP